MSKTNPIPFDSDKQMAVIKCSICTGEMVAGFKNKEDGYFTEVMLIKNEADAKFLATVLSQCNDIVKEEFIYQPGADLTQKDVLGIFFTVYSSTDKKEKLGNYYLNGKDDEDAVYQ